MLLSLLATSITAIAFYSMGFNSNSLGVPVMIGALCLMIVLHEFGHWFVARLLGFQTPIFSIGFGKPYFVFARKWGTEFRITPWLIGGFVALPEMGDESTGKEFMEACGFDTTGYVHKQFAIWKRAAVAVAGVTMNVITALVITFALLTLMGKPHYDVTDVYVSELSTSNTIAKDAGIQPNDVLMAVDGKVVADPADVSKLVSAHKGTPVQLTVKRGGNTVNVVVTPNADGRIGIVIGAHQTLEFKKLGLGEAVAVTVGYNIELAKEMAQGLAMMMHIVPAPKDLPPGATDVHGVVAIVQIGAAAFNAGWYQFFDILVRISMMLAFMNILPIPVLDGGYLIFMAIEKVRGKPISRDWQLKIKSVFMMLLLALMCYAILNDFINPVNFGK